MQNEMQTQTYADDEIDLLELWNNLWEQKWLIAAITTLTTSLGIAYALLATPIYKAETFFLPPLQQDVQSLKLQNMQNITPDFVYQRFLQNLQSRSLQKQFYEMNNLQDFYAQGKPVQSESQLFLKAFHEKLTLNLPKKKQDQSFVSLSFELPRDAALSAQWLNDYTAFVATKTKAQIIEDVNFEVQSKIKNAQEQVESKRALAKQRREDEIARLEEARNIKLKGFEERKKYFLEKINQLNADKIVQLLEALKLAKSLGIVKNQITMNKDNSNAVIQTYNIPGYLKGTEAIQAEISALQKRVDLKAFHSEVRNLEESLNLAKTDEKIEVLKNRVNDDPFIEGIRNLQETMAYLSNVEINPATVQVARIDQVAVEPVSAVKPKKALIAAVALVLGGMLGVFIALIRSAVRKRKLNVE